MPNVYEIQCLYDCQEINPEQAREYVRKWNKQSGRMTKLHFYEGQFNNVTIIDGRVMCPACNKMHQADTMPLGLCEECDEYSQDS